MKKTVQCVLSIIFLALFPKLSFGGDKAPKGQPLDKGIVERVRVTYAAVLNNDDKKAKLLYGRNYKYMPEVLQFAFDLRFKNFEHALSVLPKSGKSPGEIEFWEKAIKSKGSKIGQTICEMIKKDNSLFSEPLPISHDETAWAPEIAPVANEIIETSDGEKSNKPVSHFDEKLGSVHEPLTDEEQKALLVETFFDDLHNMQRRDTRFVQQSHGSFIKIKTYRRYVEPSNLFKFFLALKATEIPKREHFLRRLGGIGRDLRPESLSARAIGDEILNDKKDQALLDRLNHLVHANALLNYSIGLDYDLGSCGL